MTVSVIGSQDETQSKLTSERFADFTEALDTLYIRGNISGRNQFTGAWPETAIYLFQEELMLYDREGAPDKERRTVLEDEAEGRRLDLLDVVAAIEDKSVDKGTLQVEYVEGLINRLGRKLALNIYAKWLVDRFLPPAPGEEPEAIQHAPAPVDGHAEHFEEIKPIPGSMDHVKPISVEPEEPQPVRQVPPKQEPAPVPPKPEAKPFDDEDDDPPLFVAGQVPGEGGPAKAKDLIVETHGSGTAMPAAPEQESMAPVVGQKKAGLKITTITDSDPNTEN